MPDTSTDICTGVACAIMDLYGSAYVDALDGFEYVVRRVLLPHSDDYPDRGQGATYVQVVSKAGDVFIVPADAVGVGRG